MERTSKIQHWRYHRFGIDPGLACSCSSDSTTAVTSWRQTTDAAADVGTVTSASATAERTSFAAVAAASPVTSATSAVACLHPSLATAGDRTALTNLDSVAS